MKKAYMVFAFLIALEVLVQASMMAWAIFGFGQWIDDGNVFNKEVLDCDDCGWNFTEERGFMVHGLNGAMIIPALSLIFLILSFFAKVPGGVKWALALFVLVLVQSQVLPFIDDEYSIAGLVHGVNALVIFAVAVMAGKRVKTATAAPQTEVPAAV